MGKQKVVLKLSMDDARRRAKALKCVVGVPGVVLASVEGDKITVVGEGVDSVVLTTQLRKKMGYVELLTVAAVEEKKEEKKEAKAPEAAADPKTVQPVFWPPYYPHPAANWVVQQPSYSDVREAGYDNENTCSIM